MLSLGLVLGLAVGGLGAIVGALPAGATAVSSVSFTGASQSENVVTNWTIGFTASGALASSSTVTVTFDSNFTVPVTPVVTVGAGFAHCSATAATASHVVTVTLHNFGGTCALASGTPATLTIDGIANPVAAAYANTNFSVATSADTTAVHPASNVVILAVVSGVTFVGSSQASNASGTTWTIGFTTGANGALSSGNIIVVTFAAGFAIPLSPVVTLNSGFVGCTTPTNGNTSGETVTITLTGGGCSVGNNTAVSLSILGITNPGGGSYAASLFTVRTTGDPTLVSPANPVAIGISSDGSGTMTVAPTSAGAGSTTDTLVFTYTAATGGLNSGAITVAVPSGWSVPSTTVGAAGYTTATCGFVSIVGASIQVSGVTLAGGTSCTITYGSKAGGGPGATAPSTPQTSTFTTAEQSTATGTLTTLAVSPQVAVGGTPLPIQIFGADPVGTAIAISQAEFPNPGSAGAVVLARSDFFSDALAGGPLAAAVGGPLLITPGASINAALDARVLTEIQRVLTPGGTVYVLGGILALSPNIDATLTAQGFVVIREAGNDLYQTAYDIALAMGSPSTIIEATGLNFFDALSAVPAAIQQHAAILLTNGNTQAFVTGIYIVGHPGITRYAVGGPLAAYGADPGAIPVYGQDLYATSNAVAATFFAGATIFGAATAATFTDALGGGVFMATGGRMGALLLVNPSAPLPSEILPYLNSLAIGTQGYVFGGPLAVDGTDLTALQQAVG